MSGSIIVARSAWPLVGFGDVVMDAGDETGRGQSSLEVLHRPGRQAFERK